MAPVSPDNILKIGFGFWPSKTLLSAIELGVFTLLAKGPADLSTLRKALGLHPRSADDFLDGLVALKLLDKTGGVYRNTPDTDLFLDRTKPTYVGGILEMANARLYHFWGDLTEGLKTGKPQNEIKQGGDLFGTLYADPEKLRGFLAAMSGISAGAANAIAAKFPWAKYKTFADIGTAQGMLPVTVASAHPHLSGIGFDLPPVKPIFEDFVAHNKLSQRLTFQAGNFFEDSLPKTDVIVMGHILHDWSAEQNRMLMKKAYDALPSGGALVCYDAVIDDARRENVFGLMMSLNMLIETPNGKDYTGAECQAWMREAGFTSTRVEALVGPDSMVIGVK